MFLLKLPVNEQTETNCCQSLICEFEYHLGRRGIGIDVLNALYSSRKVLAITCYVFASKNTKAC